ncbi:MAG: hypothetical protein ACK4M1_05340 [Flavobacterium sp.]
MNKKQILWVVYDFVQAGGQRYVFEICKALNKQKHQIDFLQVNDLNADKNWDTEFYYQPTLDLGCTIYSLSEILSKSVKNLSSTQKKINKISEKLFSKIVFSDKRNQNTKSSLEKLFAQYDYVNFSGISVYNSVCINNGLHPNNGFINILTAKFQGVDIYKNYNKELFYNFISGFEPNIQKYELSDFKKYEHIYFPLSLECFPFDIGIDSERRKYVVGVFTRLSPMKPMDPYFYALKLLVEQGVNVELRIYGAGDPQELGLIRQLEYLYIKDRVVFCGHTESLQETLLHEKFDIVWFQAANNQVAGYSALEIAMGGVPQILWDFNDLGSKTEAGTCFPCFTNLSSFVEFSKSILLSKEDRKELGLKQQNFVLKNHDVKKNIIILENLYQHGK